MNLRRSPGTYDFHVHTIHSNCGKAGMTPSAVLGMYLEAGYREIGFTDHYDPILSPEKVRQTREELLECDIEGIDYYIGTEACTFLPDWPRRSLRSTEAIGNSMGKQIECATSASNNGLLSWASVALEKGMCACP